MLQQGASRARHRSRTLRCHNAGVSVHREPSVALVRELVAEQFPHWAGLTVREVSVQGWDNRTFRLGHDLLVRLPSADGYEPQVEREHRWLPFLGQRLSTPIPCPVAKGTPSRLFPRAWSVYRWLNGTPLDEAVVVNLELIAKDVASFLRSLQALPKPPGAPAPQESNGFRGDRFDRYVAEGEEALLVLDEALRQPAKEWLREATRSTWRSGPVWVHGDVAAGNLLIHEGRLAAVIDFGCLAVGDPACDLTVAWTIFEGRSREMFRRGVAHDVQTWNRARGWAMWKAAITLTSATETSAKYRGAERTVRELWNDQGQC